MSTLAGYTQYTLNRFIVELSHTLSDGANVYWQQPELTFALYEAMREWSGVTSYWRERGAFTAQPPSATNPPTYFYDLSTVLGSLRSRSITIDSIVREIQYHFYEPSTGILGLGMSTQFNITDILTAIIRARNRFVLDSRLPITPSIYPVSPPPDGRFYLPNNTIYLHRVAWLDAQTGIYHPLQRSSSFTMDALNPAWPLTPGIPSVYSQDDTRPLELQLFPPPTTTGSLIILAVTSLDLTPAKVTTATTLNIPDDFAHAIKYGAMSDLITTDAESANPFMADYCSFRYDSIVQAARTHRSVIAAQANTRPLGLIPLYSLDAMRTGWQNRTGTPYLAATAYDLLTFSPTPSTNFGITADVSRSAPVPPGSDSPILAGPEDIQNFMGYCQHYLSLKLGGGEFQQTFSSYDDYQRQATQRNAILNNQARYLTSLMDQGGWDQAKNPDTIENPIAQPRSTLTK